MSEQEKYPLYPNLSEEGKVEAQKLLESFMENMKKAADETIGKLHYSLIHDIESDSWSNFRNDLMDGFKNYDNRKIQNRYDFKKIRQSILKEHREDIINDLNQDMLEEISSLKKQIEDLKEFYSKLSR